MSVFVKQKGTTLDTFQIGKTGVTLDASGVSNKTLTIPNTTGTVALAAAVLNDPGGNGIVVRTSINTSTNRSLTQPAAGITITNNDGVSGNPTFALANDLSALEGLSSTGIAVRSAADTWVQRSVAGTTNRISVANGSGASGNPTVDIDSAYVGQTSITTLGTISTGTWSATAIAETRGGTNQTTYTTGDLLYASATNVLSKRAIGSTNDVLTVVGGVPTWQAPTGGGAPVDAQYVTLATNATLTNERVLTGTANQITFTDGGAGANVTAAIASNPSIPGTGSMLMPGGTTAQRTGTIVDGLLRFNTDENITEIGVGYAAGSVTSWAGLQSSLIYRKRRYLQDDFTAGPSTTSATSVLKAVGEQGWNYTASAAVALTAQNAEADHPGITRMSTGTTSGNNSRIHLGTTATHLVVMANQVEYMAFLVRIPTITSGSWKCGIGSDVSVATNAQFGNDGVWFEFLPASNAAWRFYTRASSTSATPVVGPTVVANTWYLLEAFYSGTAWTPRFNGSNGTSISSNIPTVGVNVGFLNQTGTTAARTMDVDYFAMISRELGARH